MNVTLIPFFLAANVNVNDISEWKYGPEYSYKCNVTFTVNQDTPKALHTAYFTSTIKCRPKDSNIVFCHMGNFTRRISDNNYTEENHPLEKKFAILFNETGVQAVILDSLWNRIDVNIIKVIANQFSINTNELRNNHMQQPISRYMREERTALGNCMTTYVLKRKELEANQMKNDSTFQLKVLPMPEITIPKARVSISKIREDCTDATDFTDIYKEGVIEIERFSSVLLIDDGFETFTIINGYVQEHVSSKILFFEITLALNLDSIKPAGHEFPSAFSEELFDL